MPATLSILSIVFVETVFSAVNPASSGTATGWGYKGFSILVLVVNILLNCINTKTSARLGNIFVVIKLISIASLVLAGLIVAIIFAADHSKDYGGKDWHRRGWFAPRSSVTPEGTIDWRKVTSWEALGHYSAAIYASLWAYSGWDKVSSTPDVYGCILIKSRPIMLQVNSKIRVVSCHWH